jgi:2-oxoglutarate dehydrogenase E2 component (dihydrolipoamide succinyltransferase)
MSKIEIKVPSIGESVTEVTLATWLVQEGDYVKLDQPIAEFESDKATFELPAEAAGVITRSAKEGDDIKIGAVVAYIDTDAPAPAAPASSGAQPPITQKQEQKKPVQATLDIPEKPGTEQKQAAEKTAAQPQERAAAPQLEKPQIPQIPAQPSASYATGTPSPAAKKILDEKGIEASEVQGTGIDGRITKNDAVQAEKPSQPSPERSQKTNAENFAVHRKDFSRGERVEKMSRLRKTISRRLVEVKNQTAMLTTFNEVDMTGINQIRDQYRKAFEEKNGIGLGFMSFFTKACALALQKFPAINAYIDEENIVYHDFVDISIAVSTPKGLVVPVVRNAESMSFADIEKEVKRLAIAGRDGNLTMEDMQGGTFTITNGGVFGSLMSTPIINQPQSAILGMHKVQDRPMAISGKVEIRPMMYVALSYDHRIVDGKESVGFLVTVKDYLENPERMLYGADPVKTLLQL